MIEFVISQSKTFPSIIDFSDIVESAVISGSLDMLNYCIGRCGVTKKVNRLYLLDIAAEHNRVIMLQWLHENGIGSCSGKAMDFAIEHCNLELVRWIHSNHTEGCTNSSIHIAIDKNSLKLVQWLFFNKPSVFKDINLECTKNIEIYKWLHQNNISFNTTKSLDYAALYGDLDLIKWLHNNRHGLKVTYAMKNAAEHGHFDIIRWLHENYTHLDWTLTRNIQLMPVTFM